MSRKKKEKTVYSVMSVDEPMDGEVFADIVGTYIYESDAIRACADYIMDRLEWRPDIRYALYNDVIHGNDLRRKLFEATSISRARLKKMFGLTDPTESWDIPKSVWYAIWDYVSFVLCDMRYDIESEDERYTFKIVSNPLKKKED